MTGSDTTWPSARLGNIARLHVLAAALPGVHLHERVIDADFGDVWAFVSDLERTTPLFEPDVRSVRVLERRGDRWKVQVRLPRWAGTAPLQLDVTMREGWCWMVARPQIYAVGIAAERHGSATLLAHMEGVVVPGPRWLRRAGGPLLAVSQWRHRLHVPADVARLAARIEGLDRDP